MQLFSGPWSTYCGESLILTSLNPIHYDSHSFIFSQSSMSSTMTITFDTSSHPSSAVDRDCSSPRSIFNLSETKGPSCSVSVAISDEVTESSSPEYSPHL